jgi:hypothetical protein
MTKFPPRKIAAVNIKDLVDDTFDRFPNIMSALEPRYVAPSQEDIDNYKMTDEQFDNLKALFKKYKTNQAGRE